MEEQNNGTSQNLSNILKHIDTKNDYNETDIYNNYYYNTYILEY